MFLRRLVLCLALLPFMATAADCLRLQTQSLGELDLPLPAPDARASAQTISYLQEIEVPAERCTFQGGNRSCALRSDRLEVGIRLERRGDDCRLSDTWVIGGDKRTVAGREVEVPKLQEDTKKFACATLIAACR